MEITITLPDAEMPAILKSFGRRSTLNPTNPMSQVWVNATIAELQNYLRNHVREKMINQEVVEIAESYRARRSQDQF